MTTRAATLAVAWLLAMVLELRSASGGPSELLVLFAIVVFGTPHGAFDLGLLGAPSHRLFWIRAVRYLLAAAGVVAVHLVSEPLFMIGFLVLAALHFGEGESAWFGDERRPIAQVFALGAIPVFASWAFRPDETRSLLEPLFPSGGAPSGLQVQVVGATTVGLGLVALCPRRLIDRVWPEVASVLLFAAFLPPLLAFAVWYLGIHCLRHLVRLDRRPEVRPLVRFGSLAFLALGLLLAAFVRPGGGPSIAGTIALPAFEESARWGFVGLAALTLPHHLTVARNLGPATSAPARVEAGFS